jgi:hypothetical protein
VKVIDNVLAGIIGEHRMNTDGGNDQIGISRGAIGQALKRRLFAV